MTMPTVAVAGSTGYVGGAAARELASSGIPLRLLVRDPGRAPNLPGATVVQSTYADGNAAALEGVETLLMISAAENEDRLGEHRAFIDSAHRAGVRHIVYTSFVGAAPDCTFTLGRDHFATEEYIKAVGFDFTFLRDNFYSDFMRFMVGEDGVIRGPAGDGRAALVTRADVAAVASAVLKDPAAHRNMTYNLTGPEAISMTDVATILSRRGAPVTFHNETVPEAYASRESWNAPGWQNDAWVSTYTAIANGELSEVSGDIQRILGRPAKSLSEFLSD